MKQHPGAEGLVVIVDRAEFAIVNRRAHAEGEEHAGRGFYFPAQIGVGLAGAADEIDARADGRSQVPAERARPRHKQDLEIRVRGRPLDAEVAPQVRRVVIERAEFQLADAEDRRVRGIGHGRQRASKGEGCGCPEDHPHQPKLAASHGPNLSFAARSPARCQRYTPR